MPKVVIQILKMKNSRDLTSILTLDSIITVAHGITVAPPLKQFQIMILILFYINLGIAALLQITGGLQYYYS